MELQQRLARAIRSFWTVRRKQGAAQGQHGARDQGARSQVTGGAQMDGLIRLVRDLLKESG